MCINQKIYIYFRASRILYWVLDSIITQDIVYVLINISIFWISYIRHFATFQSAYRFWFPIPSIFQVLGDLQFHFYHRWFDVIFLVSALTTMGILYLAHKQVNTSDKTESFYEPKWWQKVQAFVSSTENYCYELKCPPPLMAEI